MEPGLIKMAFLYNRPWFYDLQPGGAVSYVMVRIIPRFSLKRIASYVPVTRSTVTMYKGQQIDIKLGNSVTMPYNLWKVGVCAFVFVTDETQLMEIFDPRTGEVLNTAGQPRILEFLYRESGFVAPENTLPNATLDDRQRRHKLNPAGHQKFTLYATAPGRQDLLFSFVKPWLPDEQFERTDTVITVIVKDEELAE
eukprot:Gregarina_sp_Poly_1__10324@NODE_72_length_15994_cov_120_491179_g62_i0_p6_GENE_NODE_72_length_15994_cov_120_491179_g62_i0NODE_72_length_15994_cov_120_491179_g62_i0_p6_ORF_typecomplete_len196_score14_48Inhibitor_I42/PF09394_10/6_7e02Inhibitor_I42/PF09394_10/0_094_NODE_72_length_15994_cov_120_491179_g62_i067057292